VTLHLRARGITAVVLVIEGTTTPISFVHETLFPYARRALERFVREHAAKPELAHVFRSLRADWIADAAGSDAPPPWPDDAAGEQQVAAIVGYCAWLMDRDRKASGLKELQGVIWDGEGTLHGEVFDDVPDALRRWRAEGIAVAIYSSGSVLAQQLLFRSTPFGDLTPLIDAYFDTTVGGKRDPESYRRIAGALDRSPAQLLFVSDVAAELAAARAAGWHAVLCVRPGNTPTEDEQSIADFNWIH
jgi:enolase-phosphatase E1